MRRLSATFVAAALAVPVLAQDKPLLDLTAAPTAPAAGSGAGALALADQLGADAATIEKSSAPEARVRAELRRLARELLSFGEKAGQAGSARVVMGRTLVGALPELDKLVAGAGDAPFLHAASGDLAAARILLDSGKGGKGGADPDLVLRDALAMLTKLAGAAPGAGGWIEDGPVQVADPFAARLDAWSKCPGVTPEAVEALRQMDSLAEATEMWPAYRAAAIRTHAMIADAAAAIEAAPAWMPEPARRVLGEQLSSAITQLGSRDTRAQGLEGLTRLAGFAELIRRTEKVEDNPAGKRIRAAVAQAVAIPPSQADARTMESFAQLMGLVAARSSWPEEKALIRQLRPGYRTLTAGARQSEQQLLAALPDVLRRPEAMTDPGVLASISAHRRSVADVEGLIAVNRALVAGGAAGGGGGAGEGAEPVADKPWQNAANRVLKLSQDLGGSRADQKEAALTSLRALFTHVDRCWRFPGEDDLRQTVKNDAGKPAKERTSAWTGLSGGREAALASEITDRRAGWLFDWEKNIVVGSDGPRLEVLRELMAVMHDAGPVVVPGAAYASLQAWPGWELSPASLAAVSTGLTDQLAEATRLILAGDSAKAAEAIAKVRTEFAVALLAGRLAREAERRGVSPDRGAAAALRELTAGGPIRGRSWMGRQTEVLDDVCRYCEEVVAMRKLGAKDKAEAVLRFANVRAGEVTERMDRGG